MAHVVDIVQKTDTKILKDIFSYTDIRPNSEDKIKDAGKQQGPFGVISANIFWGKQCMELDDVDFMQI